MRHYGQTATFLLCNIFVVQRVSCTYETVISHLHEPGHTATHCNTLQHTATRCNTLQHTASHSNTQQHTTTHCNTYHKCTSKATHLGFVRFARHDSSWSMRRSPTHEPAPHEINRSYVRGWRRIVCDGHHSCPYCRSWKISKVNWLLDLLCKVSNTPQHTATHCNNLQHTATHCNTQVNWLLDLLCQVSTEFTSPLTRVLQCVAVCWSVLQCVVVCCSVLQCVAVRCSALQCVAVCSVISQMTHSYMTSLMHI